MPDVARETRDLPPKRLMGYYDICQTPLFLATNDKRPVHLTYDFSLRQYALRIALAVTLQSAVGLCGFMEMLYEITLKCYFTVLL